MNTKEIKLEKIREFTKKLTIVYKMLIMLGIFCSGCYTALFIEIGNDISIIGLVVNIILIIFSLTCIKITKEI